VAVASAGKLDMAQLMPLPFGKSDLSKVLTVINFRQNTHHLLTVNVYGETLLTG